MVNYIHDKVKDNLNYFINLKAAMDKHELKATNIHFRRNLLERQRIANYTNEMDRVRGELSRTVLHDETKLSLMKRANHLRSLGAEAISGIK